jgi:putative Mg2+ transporter-C (MgtC) family protein
MNILTEDIIKLGIAVLVGGAIGLEREVQYKAAGFRTIILITLGSTLFTLFSIAIEPDPNPSRIASNIVTGIGFLGAGTILREGGRIGGLTTAATIWLAAALGMGIGAGQIDFVLAATGVTLIVLVFFPSVGAWIDRLREARTYKIMICSGDIKSIDSLRNTFKECRLRVAEDHFEITEDTITSTWRTIGKPRNQKKFIDLLAKDKSICRLEY